MEDGRKELTAVWDSYCESGQFWCELLLDVEQRGCSPDLTLVTADVTLGFRAVLRETYPVNRGGGCWIASRKVSQTEVESPSAMLPGSSNTLQPKPNRGTSLVAGQRGQTGLVIPDFALQVGSMNSQRRPSELSRGLSESVLQNLAMVIL